MSKRTENVLKFGVRSDDGGLSGVWRVWSTLGRGRSDIYLTNPSLRGALKASLHESGSWQVGFTAEFAAKAALEGLFDRDSRHMDIWDRPADLIAGLTLAYRVIIPHAAVRAGGAIPADQSIVWIKPALAMPATEFSLLISAPTVAVTHWPGKNTGTNLVGHFPLEDGSTLWVVSRGVTVPQLPPANLGEASLLARELPTADEVGLLRVIVPGKNDDGHRFLLETIIDPESVPRLLEKLAAQRAQKNESEKSDE